MTTATGILRCHSYPLATPEFRCIKQRRLPQRALCCRQQSHAKHDDQGSPALESIPLTSCRCCVGGRRNLLLGAPLSAGSMPALRACSSDGDVDSTVSSDAKLVRPSRPRWYRELYAWSMTRTMDSYEEKLSRYKTLLFESLDLENKKVLEMGIGTGPNLKYYANTPGVHVYGVDPNEQMKKYAQENATLLGLPQPNFNFIQGVAESLPVRDNSMDAVVGTLVLCSVDDVDMALMEVKRVLKPGGSYIFIEHVASQDGSLHSVLQNVLDPLRQFVFDGCHLARETGKQISDAGFSELQLSATSIPHLGIFDPHVCGVACK